jgi:hypothetical protein
MKKRLFTLLTTSLLFTGTPYIAHAGIWQDLFSSSSESEEVKTETNKTDQYGKDLQKSGQTDSDSPPFEEVDSDVTEDEEGEEEESSIDDDASEGENEDESKAHTVVDESPNRL